MNVLYTFEALHMILSIHSYVPHRASSIKAHSACTGIFAIQFAAFCGFTDPVLSSLARSSRHKWGSGNRQRRDTLKQEIKMFFFTCIGHIPCLLDCERGGPTTRLVDPTSIRDACTAQSGTIKIVSRRKRDCHENRLINGQLPTNYRKSVEIGD